jgi:SAM-dependent methyltransferase
MGGAAGLTRADAQRFYEDFSVAVGLRDWLLPNARHEQLKILVREVLRRRDLRILDVGCGAGVMSAYLTRFGDVTGIDFSEPAIDVARRLAPDVSFIAGSLDVVPRDSQFDVITLFDVLEHIPAVERPQFLGDLSCRLVDGGILLVSTPHPAYTRHRRRTNDDSLQIIDEEVPVDRVAAEAEVHGLRLVEFRAYDVFRGSPEYQFLMFGLGLAPGGTASLRSSALHRRMRLLDIPGVRRLRRFGHAARLAGRGGRSAARWMLTGRAPSPRS